MLASDERVRVEIEYGMRVHEQLERMRNARQQREMGNEQKKENKTIVAVTVTPPPPSTVMEKTPERVVEKRQSTTSAQLYFSARFVVLKNNYGFMLLYRPTRRHHARVSMGSPGSAALHTCMLLLLFVFIVYI
jgi:hypothetical protein